MRMPDNYNVSRAQGLRPEKSITLYNQHTRTKPLDQPVGFLFFFARRFVVLLVPIEVALLDTITGAGRLFAADDGQNATDDRQYHHYVCDANARLIVGAFHYLGTGW